MNQENINQARFLQLWAMVLLYAKILGIRVMCSGSKSFIRNAAMQAELYAIGRRGIPDEVTVTICDGINSKSNHQSGQAMDITIIGEKGDVIYDEIAYKKLADFWKSLDPKARWGGDFTPREIWHYDLLA
jgi:hypothetical protein